MRAALLPDYKADLVIDDVPVSDPGPGEVLVRVAGAGLCHSDLHLVAGEVPVLPTFPWILGHEVSGYVEALGPGAHGFEHGEPVAVYGGWGCGMCRLCLGGEEQLCATTSWVGIGQPGGFAEFLVVPSPRHLVPLGDLDPVSSAPLTDAALTPYRAVRRCLPRLVPGTTAIVIGAGGLGQYAVQLLRELSAARVVAVEPSAARRATALELGAHLALTPADEVRVSGSMWGTRTELGEVIELARAGRLTSRVHERDLAAVNTAMHDLARGDVDGRIVLVP